MILTPDFKEFFALLNEHDVRYLVVGGYAVAFHGHPRYTKDVDVWIGCTAENARQLMIALTDFGFGDVGLKASDFTQSDHVIQLGQAPNRIYLLTSLEGVTFDTCYVACVRDSIDDITVVFIGLEDLRKNKLALGRPQDLADLEELQ